MTAHPPHPIAMPVVSFTPGLQTKYVFIAFLTVLAVLMYRLLSYDVRRAWLKYGKGVPQPQEENFARLHRIQENTLEHLVFFLPSLWLGAVYFSAFIATLLGVVWLIGRSWYAYSYFSNPHKTPTGFHVAMVAEVMLFLAAAIGVCLAIPHILMLPFMLGL